MSDEQMVKFLATHVMGWKVTEMVVNGEIWLDFYRKDGPSLSWWPRCGEYDRCWNPLAKISDAMECQPKIPKGKRGMFVFALTEIVADGNFTGKNVYDIHFDMVTAAPRQRCIAMVRAMGGDANA